MKALILIIVLLVGIGYSVAVGNIRIHKADTKCLYAKRPLPAGDKQTFFSMGSLEFRYQPYKWDCTDDEKYDPAVYEMVDGLLSPRKTK